MKKLLIAVAIHEEYKTLKKLLGDKVICKDSPHPLCQGTIGGYPVEILMTSMGMNAAKKAAVSTIDGEKYLGVLILGYCGGLSFTLKVGDSVIASKVRGPLSESYIEADSELCEQLGRAHLCEGLNYRNVPLITQPLVIETPADKQKLFNETHAEAVDMESFEIMSVAVERKLKTLAIKVVIDDAETELPRFNDYFAKSGKMDHLNVTQVLMSQPALSLKLSQNMKKGAAVLHKIIPQIVPLICEKWGVEKLS